MRYVRERLQGSVNRPPCMGSIGANAYLRYASPRKFAGFPAGRALTAAQPSEENQGLHRVRVVAEYTNILTDDICRCGKK